MFVETGGRACVIPKAADFWLLRFRAAFAEQLLTGASTSNEKNPAKRRFHNHTLMPENLAKRLF